MIMTILIIETILLVFVILFCLVQMLYNSEQNKTNTILAKKLKDYEEFRKKDHMDKAVIKQLLRENGMAYD